MCQEQSISEYVKRWGSSASVSLLDPNCKIFTDPQIEGMIGYQQTKKCIVVFGDPVCSPANVPQFATSFHSFCKAHSKEVVYLCASENFAQWAMKNGCNGLFEAEEELIMDPANYPKKGSNGRLLNKKINHALQAEVTIKEYLSSDEATKKAIIDVETAWLKGRKGPQIYMSQFNFFDDECGKRCFYAEQHGKIVGVLYLNRLEAQKGWLLYLLMTVADAPGGTSEYLLVTTLNKLAEEDCHFFSFGVSAVEQLGDIVGLSKFSTWIARNGFKAAKKIFSLDNRRNFWKKFQPNNKRSFVLFSRPHIGISEIVAIMKTLNVSF